MTPEQYELVQTHFLALREATAEAQSAELERLEKTSPEIANTVRQLLSNDRQEHFLDNPLVCLRNSDQEIETKDIQPAHLVDQHPDYIGPYRVLQKIGEGGHGIVFMAEQTKPIRRMVAIKWVKPGMDSKMVLARFEAERQAVAMMNHPSIANVIDAGSTDSGQPYFVLELIHGVPIDQFCNENELNLAERLELFQQVCSAVHHAHRKGIIHRDLKPANVLVTLDSGKPLAKVIDFGIAKALHLPLTEKTMYTEYGQILGTLEYMSPEQAMMSQTGIDIRSDVYSLGVLLYLLITGETPLSKNELLKKGIWELKNVLQDSDPQTPSMRITQSSSPQRWRDRSQSPENWVGHVKGDLDWITMKSLAKDPDKRYDSAAALSDDIDQYLNGDAVNARPPSTWYRISKFIRRNRLAATITLALTVSLLVSLIALSWGYYQSQKNLNVANDAIELVREKSVALQQEKRRADETSLRLAAMLKRQILKTAWSSSLDGDVAAARKAMADIAPADRSFEYRFVERVGTQLAATHLRHPDQGSIREITIHRSLGLIGIINTASKLEVWNMASRAMTLELQLPTEIYTAMSFSHSGKHLLIGSGNSVSQINLTDQTVSKPLPLRKGGIRSIQHDARQDRWFVTTGANFVCAVDDSPMRETAHCRLPKRVSPVAISPDGSHLVVGALKGQLFVLETETLSLVETVEPLPDSVASFRWLDDRLIVADSSGGLFQLLYQGRSTAQPNMPVLSSRLRIGQVEDRPVAIELSSDGKAYAASRDGRLIQFDTPNVQVAIRTFANAPSHIAMLDNGQHLVVIRRSGRICLVSQDELQQKRAFLAARQGLRDGISLLHRPISITGHDDGTIKRWNNQNGKLVHESRLHAGEVFQIDAHEGRGLVASVGADSQIVISNMTKEDADLKLPCRWGVRCVAFSPDGQFLAGPPKDQPSGERPVEGTFEIWNVDTGEVVSRFDGHTNWVTHFRFDSRGKRIVSLSVDGSARVWDVASGQCLQKIDLSYIPDAYCMAISDQGHLIIGHGDGRVTQWSLDSGKQLAERHIAGDAIVGINAVPGTKRIIVMAASRPDLIFLDEQTLDIQASLDAGIGDLMAMRADATGKQLQLIGEDQIIRIWRLVE